MIQAHYDAVKALLTPVATVHEDAAPTGATLPYVILRSDDGAPAPARLDGASDRRMFRFYATVVGATGDSCRIVATKVQTALLDARPVISGRTVGRIRWETSQPAGRDYDVPSVFSAVSTWTLQTS